VTAITVHYVRCDGRCPKRYDDLDLDHSARPAELRKLAAAQGWTHVRSSLGSRFDKDFCPDHKPEDTP
jgi:hypothetical protein